MNLSEISLFNVVVVFILLVANYLVVALIRAEIRVQHIKKFRYDYYQQLPKAINYKFLHHFKRVIFKTRTIAFSLVLSAIAFYLLFF